MFIIFEDVDNEIRMVNDKHIQYIGYNIEEYVVDTPNYQFTITERQFEEIIKVLNNYTDFHPCIDCRIPLKNL